LALKNATTPLAGTRTVTRFATVWPGEKLRYAHVDRDP
jgi:hypothetical protein